MTHRITVKISQETEPQAVFTCDEPDTAWCRQNAVGPGEEPPENPLDCWFTVLASGLAAWGKGASTSDRPPNYGRARSSSCAPMTRATQICASGITAVMSANFPPAPRKWLIDRDGVAILRHYVALRRQHG
jgi:hypothetical protein